MNRQKRAGPWTWFSASHLLPFSPSLCFSSASYPTRLRPSIPPLCSQCVWSLFAPSVETFLLISRWLAEYIFTDCSSVGHVFHWVWLSICFLFFLNKETIVRTGSSFSLSGLEIGSSRFEPMGPSGALCFQSWASTPMWHPVSAGLNLLKCFQALYF